MDDAPKRRISALKKKIISDVIFVSYVKLRPDFCMVPDFEERLF